MPDAFVTSTDPAGLATSDGLIQLVGCTPSHEHDWVEGISGSGKYVDNGMVKLRPLEVWNLEYEVYADATLTVAFGVPINTSYLITAFSARCEVESRAKVSMTVIKPSAAAKINSISETIEIDVVGGVGIVNKWGATSTGNCISSSCSISMQQLTDTEEVPTDSVSDFVADGILQYLFVQECSLEARGAITLPEGAILLSNPTTPTETNQGWQTYTASWKVYLDPITLSAPA